MKRVLILLVITLFACACDKENASSPGTPVEGAMVDAPSAAPVDPPPTTLMEPEPATGSSPPHIQSVKLTPTVVLPGTPVKAEVESSDPDGDLVMLDYEWTRNGEVIAEAVTDELDTNGFKKGDLVEVAVTPFDGNQKGETKRSSPVLILNSPPEITSFPPGAITDGKYVYEVTADDPDGDRLTFTLETMPSGMDIDTESGRLEWNIPEDLTGTFAVRIIVSDGDARTFQGFSLNLTK